MLKDVLDYVQDAPVLAGQFPFCGLYICEDFNFKNEKPKKNVKEWKWNNIFKQKYWYLQNCLHETGFHYDSYV